MRFSTLATAAAATLVAAEDMSLCGKYTAALFKEDTAANEAKLLTALVNTVVIGNYTESKTGKAIPGILKPGMQDGKEVNLAPYFSGALKSSNEGGKAVCKNFLDGGAAEPLMKNMPANDKTSNQYFLLTHLYKFFGMLLQCPHQNDPAFGAYDGDASMYEVHKFMNLGAPEFNYFVTQVAGAAASFGVSEDDIKAVGMALNSAFGEKCAPADKNGDLQAICIGEGCKQSDKAACDKYAKAEAPAKCSMASGSMSGTMAPTGTMTGMPSGTNMPSGTMMPSGTTSAPAQNTNGAAAVGVNIAAAAAGVAALLL